MKKFFLSPLVRVSFSLTLLTVSMLLIADLLGLIPDTRHAELQSRKFMAESLAVQLSNEITHKRLQSIEQILQSVVERNEIITSVAVRNSNKELVSEFGGHEQYWTLKTGDKSTAKEVLVPLFNGQSRWGSVELTFTSLSGSSGLFSLRGSFLGILLFVSLGGFLVYLLFLKRALRELNPDAVIPERVSKALDTLSEGLLVVDQKGFVVFSNLAFAMKMGLKPKELLGKDIGGFGWERHGDDVGNLKQPWLDVLAGHAKTRNATLKLKNGLGEVRILTVNASPITATEGKIRGVLITFDDITEVEAKNEALNRALDKLKNSQSEISKQNKELHWLASRDPLTGVLNRRALTQNMDLLFKETKEQDGELCCIMVDIDHFKSVNDQYGHAVGDETIKLVTRILSECSRSGDLVGRLGGEEFVVVLPDTEIKAAAIIAERMRLGVHREEKTQIHNELQITSSFGVSALKDGAASASDLLARADKALYAAKENGRNRVICWSGDISEGVAAEELVSEELPALLVEKNGQLDDALKSHGMPVAPDRLDDGYHSSSALLLDRIEQGISRTQRDGSQIAVLLMHVETLQRVEDTLGFAAREKLAKEVVARLKQTLRLTDTIAFCEQDGLLFSVSRMGDSGISIVLTDLYQPEIVTNILQRIFSIFKAPIEIESNEIYLNLNLGVSLYPRDGEDAETLIRNAGSAMREGKLTRGDNSFNFYSEEINQRAKKQIELEAALYRALERDEFVIHYQPKINLITGGVSSLEALVRWQHPQWGMVLPNDFIPLAEQTGLIEKIDRWVVRSVCRQISFWQEAGFGTVPVAVNLSPSEFRNPDLADHIITIVDEFGIPAKALQIEITETAVIDCMDSATSILEKLSSAGMDIYLDDFGTGYSSLIYLKRFPITIVKIDRSFVAGLMEDSSDAAIVSATIAMSQALGLRVVAEGVESEEQLRFLQDLQCDEVQGYLTSRPLPKEQINELLAHPETIRRMVLGDRNRDRKAFDATGVEDGLGMIGVVNEFPLKRRS
ncbi:EAL domain-containing protein [Marinobacter sp.]|uniref:bifunctional diguanylate cyclase/phosphodiesterase n=1 Tax=Marinobacter sp. TaxID=50741 RepID=UPI002B26E878|nr:EAL domain-containing protein [Marinobacter sp.]